MWKETYHEKIDLHKKRIYAVQVPRWKKTCHVKKDLHKQQIGVTKKKNVLVSQRLLGETSLNIRKCIYTRTVYVWIFFCKKDVYMWKGTFKRDLPYE